MIIFISTHILKKVIENEFEKMSFDGTGTKMKVSLDCDKLL